MRKIYIGFSGVFALCGLIIAFENIMIPANGLLIFFKAMNSSMFLPLLFVLALGAISGFFFGLAFTQKDQQGSADDEYGEMDV